MRFPAKLLVLENMTSPSKTSRTVFLVLTALAFLLAQAGLGQESDSETSEINTVTVDVFLDISGSFLSLPSLVDMNLGETADEVVKRLRQLDTKKSPTINYWVFGTSAYKELTEHSSIREWLRNRVGQRKHQKGTSFGMVQATIQQQILKGPQGNEGLNHYFAIILSDFLNTGRDPAASMVPHHLQGKTTYDGFFGILAIAPPEGKILAGPKNQPYRPWLEYTSHLYADFSMVAETGSADGLAEVLWIGLKDSLQSRRLTRDLIWAPGSQGQPKFQNSPSLELLTKWVNSSLGRTVTLEAAPAMTDHLSMDKVERSRGELYIGEAQPVIECAFGWTEGENRIQLTQGVPPTKHPKESHRLTRKIQNAIWEEEKAFPSPKHVMGAFVIDRRRVVILLSLKNSPPGKKQWRARLSSPEIEGQVGEEVLFRSNIFSIFPELTVLSTIISPEHAVLLSWEDPPSITLDLSPAEKSSAKQFSSISGIRCQKITSWSKYHFKLMVVFSFFGLFIPWLLEHVLRRQSFGIWDLGILVAVVIGVVLLSLPRQIPELIVNSAQDSSRAASGKFSLTWPFLWANWLLFLFFAALSYLLFVLFRRVYASCDNKARFRIDDYVSNRGGSHLASLIARWLVTAFSTGLILLLLSCFYVHLMLEYNERLLNIQLPASFKSPHQEPAIESLFSEEPFVDFSAYTPQVLLHEISNQSIGPSFWPPIEAEVFPSEPSEEEAQP